MNDGQMPAKEKSHPSLLEAGLGGCSYRIMHSLCAVRSTFDGSAAVGLGSSDEHAFGYVNTTAVLGVVHIFEIRHFVLACGTAAVDKMRRTPLGDLHRSGQLKPSST